MATTWKAPTWRMPNEKNQNKFESYSLNFDGTQEINSSSNLNISGALPRTFSAWIKTTDSGTGWHVIVGTGNLGNTGGNFELDFRNGKITFNDWGTDTFSGANVNDGNWHNICLTYNGTILKLYIDGVEDTSGDFPATKTINSTNTPVRIGGMLNHSQKFFNGEISNAIIFDYALSEPQISSLYNSGSPINPMTLKPAPAAYYPLGGNASTGGDPLTATTPNTLSVPNVAVPDASVFDFDGSNNEKITANNITNLNTGDLSASIWVYATNSGNNIEYVFDNSNALAQAGFTISINSSNGYAWYIGRATTTHQYIVNNVNINFTNNVWNHLCFSYNDTTKAFVLYLNGNPVNSGTATSVTKSPSTNPITIGGQHASYDFTGKLSNAQIWQAALSPTEVETLYNSGVPLTGTQPQEANLKAWYKLDQSANWEADTTGNWQIPDAVSSYPQSFDFNGTSQGVILPNDTMSSITGDFAFSFWFNQSGNGSGSFGEGYLLGTYTNGGGAYHYFSIMSRSNDIWVNIKTDGGTWNYIRSGSTQFTNNTWNNVVVQRSGNDIEIYINGNTTPVKTQTISGAFRTDWIYSRLGQYLTNGYFNGNISNNQFWNTALSSSQIETIYNNGTPLTTAIATDNLKAWYKLDNTEKFDGTNWSVENQKYPAGFDSALDFDGNSDVFIGSPSAIQNLTNITLSVWVKVPNTFGVPYYTVASKGEYAASGSQWYLTIKTGNAGPGGTFAIYKTNDSTSTTAVNYTTNIDDDKWHNIVCINDGTDLKVYIDGQLDGTNAGNGGNIYNGNRDLKIGRLTASSINKFNGLMSNMVIWGDSQETEVSNIYNNGTPATSYTNTPVAWWKLNNTTTGIQDSIGSNNGTNNGTTKVNTFVSTEAGTSSGMTEQNLVNNNVSALNGESSGMNTSNLVTSTLTRQIPYNSYSLKFDGVNDYINCGNDSSLNMADNGTDSFTFSFWIKRSSTNTEIILSKQVDGSSYNGFEVSLSSNKVRVFLGSFQSPQAYLQVISTNTITGSDWKNVIITYDGSQTTSGFNMYINKVQETLVTLQNTTPSGVLNSANFQISGRNTAALYSGSISNVSYWNTALTSTEIQKIYNSGVPGDLSNFIPSPISWWTLGSDSYFNGTSYICPDLISTNNGTSSGMDANALIGDAPNSTANGTSTNMTIDANLTGNAPNSSNNSFSVNMSYDDRETDVPS